ncbi:unnamed protein product [Thelazia callipaeda]|uniref:Glycogen [starch] synthase n=1 Tax=Thelazia callipaeda TaxID=103827 RepID=A0A0N5CTW4_THECL|nr:unnamed protein product [Thelazia callipaeda]
MNEWKQEILEKCQIGVPHEDIESNDTIIFGFMVAIFLKHFTEAHQKCNYHSLVVAHFHEWQSSE